MKYDYLIIGGGVAGGNALWAIHEKNQKSHLP